MKNRNKLSLIEKFIYKFFIAISMLFTLVLLDKYKVLNINMIKDKIDYNINVLNVIKKLNGKIKLIDIGINDELLMVSNETDVSFETSLKSYPGKIILDNDEYQLLEIDNLSMNGVEVIKSGVITKILKNDYYSITILGIDNIKYEYCYLFSFDKSIYQYLKTNEIIGKANNKYYIKIYK